MAFTAQTRIAHNGEVYEEGDVIEDMTDDQAQMLIKDGYVADSTGTSESVDSPDDTTGSDEADVEEETTTVSELNGLSPEEVDDKYTGDQLKEMAANKGLKVSGSKPELIDRLLG